MNKTKNKPFYLFIYLMVIAFIPSTVFSAEPVSLKTLYQEGKENKTITEIWDEYCELNALWVHELRPSLYTESCIAYKRYLRGSYLDDNPLEFREFLSHDELKKLIQYAIDKLDSVFEYSCGSEPVGLFASEADLRSAARSSQLKLKRILNQLFEIEGGNEKYPLK